MNQKPQYVLCGMCKGRTKIIGKIQNYAIVRTGEKRYTILAKCERCGEIYQFLDDHKFFQHPQASTKDGAYVLYPTSSAQPEKVAPKPQLEKEYHCTISGCKTLISKEQAVRTFKEQGRALCSGHEEGGAGIK